jgi:hypothetical protein
MQQQHGFFLRVGYTGTASRMGESAICPLVIGDVMSMAVMRDRDRESGEKSDGAFVQLENSPGQ